MSRKIIMFVLAIVMAIVTVLQEHIGISVAAGGAISALVIILTYLFGEFMADRYRFEGLFTEKKWLDPNFWLALVGTILPIVWETFQIPINIEIVNSVLAIIIGLIFKKRVSNAKRFAPSRR